MPRARIPAVALACLVLLAASSPGAVSWDEHDTVDGVRWTARGTHPHCYAIGSDRPGERAIATNATGRVVIPARFRDGKVVSVGDWAFEGMAGIEEVVIPEGVQEIGARAFANCTGLKRISFSSSVVSLRDGAFAGCTSLRELELPETLHRVCTGAFEGCTGLEILRLPNKGQLWGPTISFRAFADCTALHTVDGQRSPTLAKPHAGNGNWSADDALEPGDPVNVFAGCPAIREVTIFSPDPGRHGIANLFPDAYREIERVVVAEGSFDVQRGMFQGCPKLHTVVLPDTVQTIYSNAFANCPRLVELRMPRGFNHAQPGAFRDSSVETLVFPPGMQLSAIAGFSGCETVKRAVFEDGTVYLPSGVLRNCTGLERVELPDTVRDVSLSAFYGCPNLREIVAPARLFDLPWTNQLPDGCALVPR
ncbi:MAG: leucine-rich repeat domain-containing protein [Kiritimatiellae bacterium]|nr:leucine-rich repeat domain-containing protein [Kiritimatiellia bacterium]